MKTSLTGILVLLSYVFLHAQTWEYLTPLKLNTEIRGCSFLDENNGIATLTVEGRLIQTHDGGNTWQLMYTPALSGNIYDVEYVSNDSIYYCGSNGSLYRSIDGGTSWLDMNPPTGEWLYQVYFINSSTGIACGQNGAIVRTDDGGNTWSLIPSSTTNRLWGIDFVNEQIGFIAGWNGTVLKTTDAGQSWTTLNTGNTASYQSVDFIDAQTGWICGSNGTVLKTTNGGTSWTLQNSGGSNTMHYIHFRTAQNGWAVGAWGNYFTTSNGGNTWTTNTTLGSNDLYCGDYVSGTAAYVMGMRNIYKSSNNTTSWDVIKSGVPRADYAGIYFLDDNTGTIAGRVGAQGGGSNQGGIAQTSDGGSSWTVRQQSSSGGWNAVFFPDANTGYVVSSGNMGKTTNGGLNWTYSTPFSNSATCLWFNDAQKGWVGANFGFTGLCSTTNGGSSFSCSGDFVPTDIYFVNDNVGYAIVGVFGTLIYKTTDGGANWEFLTGNGGTCVYFQTETNGWIGSTGTIRKTTDGGLSWTETIIGGSNILDIRFYSDNLGFCVTSEGIIYRTTDAGETWEYYFADETTAVPGLAAQFTENYCYVSGPNGDVYRCELACTSFQAGLIYGDNAWCENQTGNLAVSQVTGATSYDWSLPDGWTGATNSFVIQPIASAVSGLASVTITNGCGLQSTVSYAVTVTPQVSEITEIQGPTQVCSEGSYIYTVPEDPNADEYLWQSSAGLTTGDAGAQLFLSAAQSDGLITVQSSNACGTSNYASLNIELLPDPVTVFELPDDSLCSGIVMALSGGSPEGGSYSGVYVSNNILDLSGADEGSSLITYTYTDGNGCVGQTSSEFTVITELAHPANFNGDCSIDDQDVQMLLENFGCINACGTYDLNVDGFVGVDDIVMLMGFFGL